MVGVTILTPRKGPNTRRSVSPVMIQSARLQSKTHRIALVSQQLLHNVGRQAARPRISRDLRHDIVERFAGPRDDLRLLPLGRVGVCGIEKAGKSGSNGGHLAALHSSDSRVRGCGSATDTMSIGRPRESMVGVFW